MSYLVLDDHILEADPRVRVIGIKSTVEYYSSKERGQITNMLYFHARLAYHVHETEEIYTVTQLNLAKLTKEPSCSYV